MPDARRVVDWDGFVNARDLGGLRTRAGAVTRYGAYVRSGSLRQVTPAGWAAAYSAGLRTVVDLRNDDEIRPVPGVPPTRRAGTSMLPPVAADAADPPAGIERIEVALDGIGDVEFWQRLNADRLNGTPLYYRPFLDRMPQRVAAVVRTLARAPDGTVLFHCSAGRDRTGLVALLLLALVDVDPDHIADDYELSAPSVAAFLASAGWPDPTEEIAAVVREHGHTTRSAVLSVLEELDVERYLLSAGVAPADIGAIRGRLLG
jgi:hypothetical protein